MADSKRSTMVRSKLDVLCKKHPKHRQSPGVCSICLTEKLSRLSNSSRSTTTANASSCYSSSLSSISSYCSSLSASSCSSPMSLGWEAKGYSYSFPFFKSKKINELAKSRSMASDMRVRGGDEGKKKGGFWSKLIRRPRGKRMDEVLMHSRTMRDQRVTATGMVY